MRRTCRSDSPSNSPAFPAVSPPPITSFSTSNVAAGTIYIGVGAENAVGKTTAYAPGQINLTATAAVSFLRCLRKSGIGGRAPEFVYHADLTAGVDARLRVWH